MEQNANEALTGWIIVRLEVAGAPVGYEHELLGGVAWWRGAKRVDVHHVAPRLWKSAPLILKGITVPRTKRQAF